MEEKDRLKKLAGIKKNIYSCILIDERSKKEILNKFKSIIPNDWKIYAHHMKINFGTLDQVFGYKIGDIVSLNVSKLGISEKAIAVEVDGRTNNKIPHITIAINVNEGGKPVMSNDIKDWKEIESFKVFGEVIEI